MTVTEALALMKALAQQVPAIGSPYPLEAPKFEKATTHSEIAVLEEDVGERLPEAYKEFLRFCGGVTAMDVHNGYAIHPLSTVRRIRQQSEVPKVVGQAPVVPVGGDGGGTG